MWRGGLSAPSSLYIHAGRPLISENGTSTLLHEVMHVALRIQAAPGYDWIVEGIAEYYSLELMRRSGTVAASRALRSRDAQREWAEQAEHLCGPASTGSTTALAVSIFLDLDREIREASDERFSLDDLLSRLLSIDGEVDLSLLTTAAAQLIGANPDVLHIDKLPGCRKMTTIDP
jgi:predicted metalloprotease with PDZ domain